MTFNSLPKASSFGDININCVDDGRGVCEGEPTINIFKPDIVIGDMIELLIKHIINDRLRMALSEQCIRNQVLKYSERNMNDITENGTTDAVINIMDVITQGNDIEHRLLGYTGPIYSAIKKFLQFRHFNYDMSKLQVRGPYRISCVASADGSMFMSIQRAILLKQLP